MIKLEINMNLLKEILFLIQFKVHKLFNKMQINFYIKIESHLN